MLTATALLPLWAALIRTSCNRNSADEVHAAACRLPTDCRYLWLGLDVAERSYLDLIFSLASKIVLINEGKYVTRTVRQRTPRYLEVGAPSRNTSQYFRLPRSPIKVLPQR